MKTILALILALACFKASAGITTGGTTNITSSVISTVIVSNLTADVAGYVIPNEGNLGAVYTTVGSLMTVTNWTVGYTNNFTGNQLQGTLTNRNAGLYVLSTDMEVFDTSGGGEWIAEFTTNGVKAGFQFVNNLPLNFGSAGDFDLNSSQIFTLTAGTRCEIKIVDAPNVFGISCGHFVIQRVQ